MLIKINNKNKFKWLEGNKQLYKNYRKNQNNKKKYNIKHGELLNANKLSIKIECLGIIAIKDKVKYVLNNKIENKNIYCNVCKLNIKEIFLKDR